MHTCTKVLLTSTHNLAGGSHGRRSIWSLRQTRQRPQRRPWYQRSSHMAHVGNEWWKTNTSPPREPSMSFQRMNIATHTLKLMQGYTYSFLRTNTKAPCTSSHDSSPLTVRWEWSRRDGIRRSLGRGCWRTSTYAWQSTFFVKQEHGKVEHTPATLHYCFYSRWCLTLTRKIKKSRSCVHSLSMSKSGRINKEGNMPSKVNLFQTWVPTHAS